MHATGGMTARIAAIIIPARCGHLNGSFGLSIAARKLALWEGSHRLEDPSAAD
jgi:hypothetical protein